MNKSRRRELLDIVKGLNAISDKDDLNTLINTLDNLKYDEESYYDNIPENLQYSQRAIDSEAAIDKLEDALDLLNEAYNEEEFNKNNDLINQAIDKINNAIW